MPLCDIVDQLHDQDGFANTSSSEETDLSSTLVRSQ